MDYINSLLRLSAAQQRIELSAEQRADADRQAENAWHRRKVPIAAYWRAVATYARHTAHALRDGPRRLRVARAVGMRTLVALLVAYLPWLPQRLIRTRA